MNEKSPTFERRILRALHISPRVLERLVEVSAWITGLVLWTLVTLIDPDIPSPFDVANFMATRVDLSEVWDAVVITSVRFWSSIAVAMVLGTILGLIMGLSLVGRGMIRYPTVAALALPSFIWSLLGAMWFGTGWRAPVMTCILAVLPFIAFNVTEGVQAISSDLKRMSDTYGVGLAKRVRHLYIPAIFGSLLAGFRVGVIVGWTAILIAEWFAGDAGLGFLAHYWYTVPSFEGFLSLCVVFVVYIVLIDTLIVERLYRRSQRWRTDSEMVQAERARTMAT